MSSSTTNLVIAYAKVENEYNQEECKACSQAFQPNSKVVVTKCDQIFHAHCLREWKESKPDNNSPQLNSRSVVIRNKPTRSSSVCLNIAKGLLVLWLLPYVVVTTLHSIDVSKRLYFDNN